VDDSERNLKLARDVLVAAGFRTIEAASGAEGIALADAHLPDVILMDLELPDLNGAEVARELAASPRTASIPVVLLSAFALAEDAEWLREAHFAGCLAKPIDVERFPAQVRGFCPHG
jgi:CheY-like chemotaxis protein